MNTDEQDELWHLLGKAKKVEPNPFLARNVLREIRHQGSAKPASFSGLFRNFAFRWKLSLAAGTTAVLLLGLGAALNSPRLLKSAHTYRSTKSSEAIAVQPAAQNPDFEIIAHLDELVALQENSLWTDASQD